MKIILVVHQFFPEYSAGTEVLTLGVAQELIAKGHDVLVFSGHVVALGDAERDEIESYSYAGVPVIRFRPVHVREGPTNASLVRLEYDNELAAKHFSRVLDDFMPDVVHFFHLVWLGIGLVDAVIKRAIPAYMTPTDFWATCFDCKLILPGGTPCSGPSRHAGNCVRHLAIESKLPMLSALAALTPTWLADLVVWLTAAGWLPKYPFSAEVAAVGRRYKEIASRMNMLDGVVAPTKIVQRCLAATGVAPGKLVLARFGTKFPVGPKRHRTGARTPLVVGFIGTLIEHKGCHILIEAFRSLPRGTAVLRIYGDTSTFPSYVEILRHAALGRVDIEFCGTFDISQIDSVLDGIDALVVPSLWYENTPLVVYAAQANLCPVVGSDFPGISEVVEHGVNGLLFEPANVRSLTEALLLLTEDAGLLGRLSASIRPPKTIRCYVDELVSVWNSTPNLSADVGSATGKPVSMTRPLKDEKPR